MPLRYYPAIVEGGERPGFSVFFPDLPGLGSAGETVQEAARNAEMALMGHLALMIADGDPLPEASDLDRIPIDPEVSEVARLLVRAELPGRVVRLNITLDEGLVASLDKTAALRGMSRSGLLAEAARRLLGEEKGLAS